MVLDLRLREVVVEMTTLFVLYPFGIFTYKNKAGKNNQYFPAILIQQQSHVI